MDAEQKIIIFKALADKTRLAIVRTVATGECPTTIAGGSSKLSQPAMSHHFAILVKAGVLLERKDGKRKFYEIDQNLLESLGINPDKL